MIPYKYRPDYVTPLPGTHSPTQSKRPKSLQDPMGPALTQAPSFSSLLHAPLMFLELTKHALPQGLALAVPLPRKITCLAPQRSPKTLLKHHLIK